METGILRGGASQSILLTLLTQLATTTTTNNDDDDDNNNNNNNNNQWDSPLDIPNHPCQQNETPRLYCLAGNGDNRRVCFVLKCCRGHGRKATRHSRLHHPEKNIRKTFNVRVRVPIKNHHAALGLKHVASTRLLHERVKATRLSKRSVAETIYVW